MSKPKQPVFPIARLRLTKILERGECPQTPRARASLGLRVSEHMCVSEHVCQCVQGSSHRGNVLGASPRARMCPGQWGCHFPNRGHCVQAQRCCVCPRWAAQSTRSGGGGGGEPLPPLSVHSQFSMWSATAHLQEDVPFREQGLACVLSVIISVSLKESVPGLLCCVGCVGKWGVYHDPLSSPIHLTTDASPAPGPAAPLWALLALPRPHWPSPPGVRRQWFLLLSPAHHQWCPAAPLSLTPSDTTAGPAGPTLGPISSSSQGGVSQDSLWCPFCSLSACA